LVDMRKRLETQEKGREDTVEGILARIFHLVRATDALFSKDAVFDLVINLMVVAKETKHPKAGYYRQSCKPLSRSMLLLQQIRPFPEKLLCEIKLPRKR